MYTRSEPVLVPAKRKVHDRDTRMLVMEAPFFVGVSCQVIYESVKECISSGCWRWKGVVKMGLESGSFPKVQRVAV